MTTALWLARSAVTTAAEDTSHAVSTMGGLIAGAVVHAAYAVRPTLRRRCARFASRSST